MCRRTRDGVPLAGVSWKGLICKMHKEVTYEIDSPDPTSRGAARRIPEYYSSLRNGIVNSAVDDPMVQFEESRGATHHLKMAPWKIPGHRPVSFGQKKAQQNIKWP